MKKPSILYIYSRHSSFIQKDLDFLSKHYEVRRYNQNWQRKYLVPFHFISQFLVLFFTMRRYQSVFVMFGGYWSFVPTILGKVFQRPVYIILGGTDCVSFPSINYGSLRKPIQKKFIEWSYKMAAKLLPVDESLIYADYNYYENADYPAQGYKYFFPQIDTPAIVIHNGFEPNKYDRFQLKTSNTFISVADIQDNTRFLLKGIDKILFLAREFPQCSFTVIGVNDNYRTSIGSIPENLELIPFMSSDKFIALLVKSEFYLQLSISEGFPNALAEGMLCQCIPIGSSVGAIPNIIEKTGFVISSSSNECIRTEISKIINLTQEKKHQLGKLARERIIHNFHISNREQKFLELLN